MRRLAFVFALAVVLAGVSWHQAVLTSGVGTDTCPTHLVLRSLKR